MFVVIVIGTDCTGNCKREGMVGTDCTGNCKREGMVGTDSTGNCKWEGMVLGHPKIAYQKHYEIVCLTAVLHLYLQVHVIQVITPKVLISLLHLNLTRCE
jgi:hypothetical protein